jgi:AcrR family transcriptional regulator
LNNELRSEKVKKIISSAQEVIAKKSGFSVSIQDVADSAGVSKGAVLHYFPTKSSLFKSVFEDFFNRIFERGKGVMAELNDPVERIKSFADWLYDSTDPDVPLGYPLFFECMYRAVYEEDFKAAFHNWITGWVSMLERSIREGIKEGKIREVDPAATARAISAVYQGVASRWYLDRPRHPDEWATKVVKDTIDMILSVEY